MLGLHPALILQMIENGVHCKYTPSQTILSLYTAGGEVFMSNAPLFTLARLDFTRVLFLAVVLLFPIFELPAAAQITASVSAGGRQSVDDSSVLPGNNLMVTNDAFGSGFGSMANLQYSTSATSVIVDDVITAGSLSFSSNAQGKATGEGNPLFPSTTYGDASFVFDREITLLRPMQVDVNFDATGEFTEMRGDTNSFVEAGYGLEHAALAGLGGAEDFVKKSAAALMLDDGVMQAGSLPSTRPPNSITDSVLLPPGRVILNYFNRAHAQGLTRPSANELGAAASALMESNLGFTFTDIPGILKSENRFRVSEGGQFIGASPPGDSPFDTESYNEVVVTTTATAGLSNVKVPSSYDSLTLFPQAAGSFQVNSLSGYKTNRFSLDVQGKVEGSLVASANLDLDGGFVERTTLDYSGELKASAAVIQPLGNRLRAEFSLHLEAPSALSHPGHELYTYAELIAGPSGESGVANLQAAYSPQPGGPKEVRLTASGDVYVIRDPHLGTFRFTGQAQLYVDLVARALAGTPSLLFGVNWERTMKLESLTFPDGSTPESHGIQVVFDSGMRSPNVIPEPSAIILASIAALAACYPIRQRPRPW
jgi:hypothetical protein